MGFKLVEPEVTVPDELGIWPENVDAFNVYRRLYSSQWVVAGMGGVIGLNYTSLHFFLELEGIPRDRWPEVVDGVQVMESAAGALLRKKAE
ncbi:MAG: DUF1799 domain-containing protein [Pseudomonadota bacterium]